jgi:hypothetical protein
MSGHAVFTCFDTSDVHKKHGGAEHVARMVRPEPHAVDFRLLHGSEEYQQESIKT